MDQTQEQQQKTESMIWLDSGLVSEEKVVLSLKAHSLHYGSGVVQDIPFAKSEDEPALFRLGDHVKQFLTSANRMGIHHEYEKKDVMNAVREVVAHQKNEEGVVRALFFYDDSYLGLDVSKARARLCIQVLPVESYLTKSGLSVIFSKYRKPPAYSTAPDATLSGDYTLPLLAIIDAKEQGHDSCIIMDVEGNVCQGPNEDVFMVKEKKLYTPPLGKFSPSVMRETILKLATDMNYTVEEKEITAEAIKGADEVFFTGHGNVIPVLDVENNQVGQGEEGQVTRKIREAFIEVATGKSKKYEHWLSYTRD